MGVGINERCTVEDGMVYSLGDFKCDNDDEIKAKLKEKGIVADKLDIFIQFISNDNY
jgi:hypothetical protein